MRNYRGRHMRADLVAGLTVAVVAVPQSMALALVTGLPIQVGLYASIVPTIMASLWGSSAHLITGPTTAISLVVFTSLSELAAPGTSKYLELAFVLSLMVGVMQAGMGIARLGVLLNFVSHSVILGFSAGAAVLIGFSQIPGILGLDIAKGRSFHGALSEIVTHFHMIHGVTLLLGILTIVVVVALKRLKPSWPGTLVAMLISGVLVNMFDLESRGVAVIGAIPRSLPPFHIPDFHLMADGGRLVPGALAICLLGLVEALSIAKAIAGSTRQRLNVNQEFIGQGLGEYLGGVLQRFSGQRVVRTFGGEFPLGSENTHERDRLRRWPWRGRCCGRTARWEAFRWHPCPGFSWWSPSG